MGFASVCFQCVFPEAQVIFEAYLTEGARLGLSAPEKCLPTPGNCQNSPQLL